VASLKNKGEVITEEAEKALHDKIISSYNKQTSPLYAAARLWVDDIIDPASTRDIIEECIIAANENSYIADFKTGVFQV
jgi:acetyl-CoA carboxylase carboxyltransferase component